MPSSIKALVLALLLTGCAGNTLGRRQPEIEPLTIRLEFLQSQLDLLRVDVRELENEVAELQRQIAKLEDE